jgi:hypothetical protein
MSSIDAERPVERTRSPIERFIREVWEPRVGPMPDPWHVGELPDPRGRFGPMPGPWREVSVAYEVVKLADYLELASPGLGENMIRRFADEPLDPCGTRPFHFHKPTRPGPPPPWPGEEEPIINLDLLAAAISFVGEGAGSEAVMNAAMEASEKIAAQG